MGALVSLVSILGLFAGWFISRLSLSEVRAGKQYFLILEHFLLAVIIASLFSNFLLPSIFFGLGLFFLFWHFEFSHPVELVPVLAFVPNPIPIFLYLLPVGSLCRDLKKLFMVAAVYVLFALIVSARF